MRCEPRDVTKDGLHWVQTGDFPPKPCLWDKRMWWTQEGGWPPAKMASEGYRYLMPMPTPSEIAALVAAAEMMIADPIGAAAMDWRDIRAALEPFKETKDV